MYSVTDKCSFDECNRLKFLINYNKRRKKIGSNGKVSNGQSRNFFFAQLCSISMGIVWTHYDTFCFCFFSKDNSCDAPVMLVANKIDQYGDRMVLVEDGQRRYREIGCVGFREISVRESIEQVSQRERVLYLDSFTYMYYIRIEHIFWY